MLHIFFFLSNNKALFLFKQNNNKAMFIFIITICSYYKKDSKLLIFKSFFFTKFFLKFYFIF